MMTSAYHWSALATERRRELVAQADAARLALAAHKVRRRARAGRGYVPVPTLPCPELAVVQ